MTKDTEVRVILEDNALAANIFGNQDENLRTLEKLSGVKIVARGGEVLILGKPESIEKVKEVFEQLLALAKAGNSLSVADINYAWSMLERSPQGELVDALSEVVYTTVRGKPIKVRTLGQLRYVQALRNFDLVFGIGPAGTGKTYLAVVMAVAALKRRDVNRIVLTRPAVEAGEKLGFLPGDLQEKVDPYLRPLYDGLYDVLGVETAQKFLERNVIEVAPLAYMRGRTLDDSFIILDEAQNTTPEQMKMFLTRLGLGSKAVITGDVTQVDLPRGQYSGLMEACKILKGVEGVSFQYLSDADVVRHPLVQKIIQAYASHEEKGDN